MAIHLKLNQHRVNQITRGPSPDKETEFVDAEFPYLRLRHSPGGTLSFGLVQRGQGTLRRITLGTSHTLKLAEARQLAKAKLGKLVSGGTLPPQSLGAVSLHQALDAYLDHNVQIRPSTRSQYRDNIGRYSQDWLDTPLKRITPEMVFERHRAISGGTVRWRDRQGRRVSMKRPSPAQADLWGRTLRALFNFAAYHYRSAAAPDLVLPNPVDVLKHYKAWNNPDGKTSRLRAHQVRSWLQALDTVRELSIQEQSWKRVAFCDAIEMSLITGLRKSEIFGLSWDRVCLSGRYYWIEQTKNGDRHELPIPRRLLALLNRRASYAHAANRVFCGDDGEPLMDPRKTFAVLEQEANRLQALAHGTESSPERVDPIRFRMHDGRRTFATLCSNLGLNVYTVKRLLNQRRNPRKDVTESYVHQSVEELHPIAQRIEDALYRMGHPEPSAELSDTELHHLVTQLDPVLLRALLSSVGRA